MISHKACDKKIKTILYNHKCGKSKKRLVKTDWIMEFAISQNGGVNIDQAEYTAEKYQVCRTVYVHLMTWETKKMWVSCKSKSVSM